MDMRPKQYSETKKASKVKETRSAETSEQRAKRYSPFNPLKPLAIVGLLATAGAGMVEAMRPEGNQVKELVDSMQQTSLNRTDVPTPSQLEQAKQWYAETLGPSSPFEQSEEKLPKKGKFARRERAKRLFEARRLLQSTETPPGNNSTNATSSSISCTSRADVWGRAGYAAYRNTVVCNGVYDNIRATAEVQLSTSGGWQTVKYDGADCSNNNQCTASGSVSGQSGQYVRTMNGWSAAYKGSKNRDGGTIGGPTRIG